MNSIALSGEMKPGTVISATIQVRNAGAVTPPLSRTVFVLSTDARRSANDKLLATAPTPAVHASKSAKVIAKLKLPATLNGNFYIIACADAAAKVKEISELNNCRSSVRRTAILPVLSIVRTRGAIEGQSGTSNALHYDVELSAASRAPVTFQWATKEFGSGVTAIQGDYVASSGTVTMPAGQLSTTLSVPIRGDINREDDETVRVAISASIGATLGVKQRDATIIDDDEIGVSFPISGSSETSVRLGFTATPSNLAADGSQFSIPGLIVSHAEQNGTFVTLTTSLQVANVDYAVTISPTLLFGTRTVNGASHFTGYGPVAQLEITEVSPNITGDYDLVELRAVSGGSIAGDYVGRDLKSIMAGVAYLPNINVSAGDFILIHSGNPVGVTTETASKADCVDAECANGAWDVRTPFFVLTTTSKVLEVAKPNDVLMDGVAFRDSGATPDSGAFLSEIQLLQAANLWLPANCGGSPCDTGMEYDTIAFNWSTVGTTSSGDSASRSSIDTNQASDWSVGTPSWGMPNP